VLGNYSFFDFGPDQKCEMVFGEPGHGVLKNAFYGARMERVQEDALLLQVRLFIQKGNPYLDEPSMVAEAYVSKMV
jgi:hypothetical protein